MNEKNLNKRKKLILMENNAVAKDNKIEAYLVKLEGCDSEMFLVDKETFDWLSAPYKVDETNMDLNLPESLKKRLYAGASTDRFACVPAYEEFGVFIHPDSYDNDRAAQSNWLALNINGEIANFETVKQMTKFCKDNNINILAEYDGYSY